MVDRLRTLRGGRALILAVALAAVALLAGRLVVDLWVEVLWQREVGYLSTFWTRAVWSWGVRLGAAVLVTLVLFLNLRWVARTLGGIQIKRQFGNLEISEKLPERYVFWGIFVLSALLGLWFGGSVSGDTGQRLLLAVRGGVWGIEEPVFGLDASFYVFVLPLLRAGVAFGQITLFLVFTVCVGGYAATGALRWGQRGVVLGHQPRVHLGAMLALFLLLVAIQFWLGRYTLLQFGNSGVQDIFGYTDAMARLPAQRVLAVLTVFAAVTLFWGAWTNRLVPVLASLGIVVLAGLAAGQFYPALVQRFQVEPNELARETPFIERSLRFTRLGFGLAEMEERPFAWAGPLGPGEGGGIDWSLAADQMDGLPVWTDATLLTSFRETQARFKYYHFASVDIDRYERTSPAARAEAPVPVALSVREIDPDSIENRSWQNLHLRETYVTGRGAVAAAAAQRTDEGRPPLVLQGLPPEFDSLSGVTERLRLTQPRVYVMGSPQTYAILNPSDTAFLASDSTAGLPGRDYPAGIPLTPLPRKLAFAWRFQDANLLFSSEVTARSRLVFRRQVAERAAAIAPFLDFPAAPYAVVHEGRIVWILEGFTSTRSFPLSAAYPLVPLGRRVNYVRNSVKVVVDGVTGRVEFYAVPGQDPLLASIARAYPDLLQPLSDLPQHLSQHLRYPEPLLDLQARVLLQYHQETPAQFYGQQDVWATPRELFRSAEAVAYRPAYAIYRLPADEEDLFQLTTTFVPAGRQNLTGILSGRLNPTGEPRLVLYDVAVADQVPGPRQVEALVEQDPEISQQFSLWRTGGSEVWTGHLHLVPVGGRMLYMEPVFLAAESDAIPQLQAFVVSDGNRVVMETTLRGALSAMAGAPLEAAGGPAAEAPPGGEPRSEATALPEPGAGWPDEALSLLDRAEARLRAGDYTGFGARLDSLRALLGRLRDSPAGGGSDR